MTYRCTRCGREWDDQLAVENDMLPTRRCNGRLVPEETAVAPEVDTYDLTTLPYPVALTAQRFGESLETSDDILKTLFRLKDCFEAAIKYLGVLLLTDYFRSSACTDKRSEMLLEKMVRPSLGVWVGTWSVT